MNPLAKELVREDCLNVLEARVVSSLAPLRGQNLTIAGGTGFLGTWLAEMVATLNDHYSFGCMLYLIARSTDLFQKDKVHLAKRKDIKYIKSDVRHVFELPKDTTYLVHAAANPDNRFHASNPIETMSVIAEGTNALLRSASRLSNLKKMMYVSSGLIYGSQPLDQENFPIDWMGMVPCGSVSSAYAEAKRFAETLCSSARSQIRLPLVTVRPFAFIGPYHSLETPWAINNFLSEALKGKSIRVLGDGKTVRSYLYPSDMAVWLLTLLCHAPVGGTYNLGSDEAVTLEALAKIIASYFSPQPSIQLNVSSSKNMVRSRFVPDISQLEAFDLQCTIDLKTAIKQTVKWNLYMQQETISNRSPRID